jgi:hypothetical protein
VITAFRNWLRWRRRTDETLELAAQIIKRQQEEIRELQRHAVSLERNIIDAGTALTYLAWRLAQRGVLNEDDAPADAINFIN